MSQSNAQLTLSIFVLAFGLGPLVLAPCTEIFGRPVWLLSGVFYTLWSIVCGFSSNKSTLIASRLLSGLGGSVDFAVSRGFFCLILNCLIEREKIVDFVVMLLARSPIPFEVMSGDLKREANLLLSRLFFHF